MIGYWICYEELLTRIVTVFLTQKAKTRLKLLFEGVVFFFTLIQLFANSPIFIDFCTEGIVLLSLNIVPFAVFIL